MTSAKVREILSIDVDALDQYVPEDPVKFCIQIRVLVGPRGSVGEESFDLKICTPAYLADLCEKHGFVIGRHYLIVDNYHFPFLRDLITKLVERCTGDSWEEVATKVARLGYWEFEDYQPAST